MPSLPCPNCRGRTTITEVSRDYIQSCICGYTKYILRHHTDGTVSLYTQPKRNPTYLPKSGTKLHLCLLQLVEGYPTELSTLQVSSLSGLVKGDVASMLIVLMNKGLVERLHSCKGKRGGSIWGLTKNSITYFKLIGTE